MLLAVDIGNTHTTFGLFKGRELTHDWRTSSSAARTSDDYGVLVQLLLSQADVKPAEVRGVVISSVVPPLTDTFCHMSEKYFQQPPLVVTAELDLGIDILYDDPSQVGADRLCNAYAGIRKYDLPLIVVDFGTATTFDVISSSGAYMGGVIAPGIETSAADLFRRAAMLPKVDLHFPEKVIGTTTIESMQAGILYGSIGMIKHVVGLIEEELGAVPTVVATGGFAHMLNEHTDVVNTIDTHLTLVGLAMIWERLEGGGAGKPDHVT